MHDDYDLGPLDPDRRRRRVRFLVALVVVAIASALTGWWLRP